MPTNHEQIPYKCEKSGAVVNYPTCKYLNPSICPHFRACLIRVIRYEVKKARGKN